MNREVKGPSGETYRLVRTLGSGATAKTWLGNTMDNRLVVLKELTLDTVEGWDKIAAFEREAAVLTGLDHPAIPRLIEIIPTDDGLGRILVLTWLEGETLRERMDKGPLTGAEIKTLLASGLELLAWLHARVPPIIHRDVTPRNAIVLPNDRGLGLIDFGAVKTALNPPDGSDTVGTFGYLAPEQLLQQASPRSDLYGLAMTLIAAALGNDILEFGNLGRGLRLRFRLRHLDGKTRHTLLAMAALDPNDRPASATEALALLRNGPPRRRRPLRALALVSTLVLTAGWSSTLIPSTGQEHRLGGWFTGHGRFLPAVTSTLFGKPNLLSSPSTVERLAFSRDGQRVASATSDGEVILWSVTDGASLFETRDPRFTMPTWVGIAEGSNEVLLASSGSLFAVSADSTRLVHTFNGQVLGGTTFTPPHPRLVVEDTRTAALLVFDLEPHGPREVASYPLEGDLDSTSLSRDGKTLAWLYESGRGNRVEIGSEPATLPSCESTASSIFAAPSVTLQAGVNKVCLDGPSPSTLEVMPMLPKTLEVSPDGSVIAFSPGHETDSVEFYRNNAAPIGIVTHRGRILATTFSPDGSLFATAGEDQLVKVWRVSEVAPK